MYKKYTSPLVSCIECRQEKSAKGIFSHYISSHTESGKINRINSGKLSQTLESKLHQKHINESKKQQKKNEYELLPKHCLLCKIQIDFEFRNNKFCSQSCSAIYNNNTRSKDSRDKQKNTLKSTLNQKKPQVKEVKSTFCTISFCKICKKLIKFSNRKTCSNECYSKNLSNHAKNNPKLGGNKNNRAYGYYTSVFGHTVWLESSYEVRVAQELDKHNIFWKRPKGIAYTIKGKRKTYYPDFFLPEFNVYLDPKNDYLIEKDSEKISCVRSQAHIRIEILNKFQLSWSEIQRVLGTGFEPARD
jgi:predicted nucleic acid-binding Zn ribbon protein